MNRGAEAINKLKLTEIMPVGFFKDESSKRKWKVQLHCTNPGPRTYLTTHAARATSPNLLDIDLILV